MTCDDPEIKEDYTILYVGPEGAKCFGRAYETEPVSYEKCKADCAAASTMFSEKRMMCLSNKDQYDFMVSFVNRVAPWYTRWMWTPLEKDESGAFVGPDYCPSPYLDWGWSPPEADSDEACSIYSMGGAADDGPNGPLPYMQDVDCDIPDPDDIWCFCEYDARISPPPPPEPPAPPPLVHGCPEPVGALQTFPSNVYTLESGAEGPKTCYANYGGAATYSECVETCASVSMTPMCIESVEEFEMLDEHFRGEIRLFWSNAQKNEDAEDDEEEWTFTNGCQGVFKWATSQPDNTAWDGVPGSQNCAAYTFIIPLEPYAFLGPSPFMIDEICDQPLSGTTFECMCEFPGVMPPPAPLAPPPFPPGDSASAPDMKLAAGMSFFVAFLFLACVLLPTFVFMFKKVPTFMADAPVTAAVSKVSPEAK